MAEGGLTASATTDVEDGWGSATKHVFPRLLKAAIEAARTDLTCVGTVSSLICCRWDGKYVSSRICVPDCILVPDLRRARQCFQNPAPDFLGSASFHLMLLGAIPERTFRKSTSP